MEEKKQYSALTIDRAAFLLLRVKRAFKKKRMQRKEREKNAQLSASTRVDQRASCAGFEGAAGRQGRKQPPPLLRSRTLPAIVVPGVSIIQAQIGNYATGAIIQDLPEKKPTKPTSLVSRFHSSRVSFSSRPDDASGTASAAASPMDRRKSAISRLCGTGSYGPDRHTDGTLLLRVPSPQVVAANAYRIPSPSSTGGSSTAFYRFSRLLTQSSKTEGLLDDSNVPRRLSWERRDTVNSRMPRSASIDSMVEAVWAESVAAAAADSATSIKCDKRPSLRSGEQRTLALVSPSVGRRLKGQRAINELPTLASECEMEVATQLAPQAANGGGGALGLPPPGHKPSKKQAKLMQQRLERLARINIHLHALFAAVEHGHLEKARTILESTDVDVNSVNNDGLSALDVAVLSNNRPLVKMLVGFGAKEGGQFSSPDKLGSHLKHLLGEAEMRLQELGGLLEEPCVTPLNTRASFSSMLGNAYPSSTITGCAGGDNDKQALAWGRRAKMMKRLVLGFTQARPPDPPALLAVDITAQHSVTVRLQEPLASESPITTKFKVQWSTRSDFSPITGEVELADLDKPICTIELTHGRRYYFRASCGNIKGYGSYLPSSPMSVVPSSWRDIEEKDTRYGGRLSDLESLTDDIKLLRPGGCDILDSHLPPPPPPPPTSTHAQFHQLHHHQQPLVQSAQAAQHQQQQPRRTTRSKKTASIKQLFSAASKFQKHLRRGIYLACILYHEDKVLLTNEDFLPVIEIDETFPSCVHTDLHWLMKVACTWEDAKSLRADMDKHASSAVHFRTRLLSAAIQMQQALCLQDLGQLFHRPLRDTHGTCVLSTVNYVSSPKSVSVLNSRWMPLNKVAKKCVLSEEHSVAEMLMGSIQEQINYHQVSSLQLSKGLYVAYLKLQSSVDMIQVVVPAKTPNILPHCKVRDNPHVSAEEWAYLKHQLPPSEEPPSSPPPPPSLPPLAPTEQQRTFLELVISAVRRLLNYMDVGGEAAAAHRLYATEVVELGAGVSCVVVCPAAENACAVPGQRELLLQRGDLLSLPIQVFEMIHLSTYQQFLVQRYSKLSCLLELDAASASHLHREAFSNSEVAIAKERLNKLQDLQNKLNTTWRCIRWLMDAIAFSRDRSITGIPLKAILSDTPTYSPTTTTTTTHHSLLLPPKSTTTTTTSGPNTTKPSGGGRGSWPGPGTGAGSANSPSAQGTNLLLHTEFSKSEQHLSSNAAMTDTCAGSAGAVGSQYLSACCSDSESRKNSGSYTSDCCFGEEEEVEGGGGGGGMVPSRSEDVLFVIPAYTDTSSSMSSRTRANTVCSSISATSSPLLSVRPIYSGSLLSVNTINTTNTSDSMHSLSSGDSDGGYPVPPPKRHDVYAPQAHQPLSSSTPQKLNKPTAHIPPSRSMNNVKHTTAMLDTSAARYVVARPKHLNVEAFTPNNLDTHLSKSMSNIRSVPEADERTYLKPKANSAASHYSDPIFKAPLMEQPGTSSTKDSSSSRASTSNSTTAAATSSASSVAAPAGILQVYAAYETGLASGTSLKLHVTPRTTAREVVDLVVKQLNMAVVLKGKDGPIYAPDKLPHFCLVAVIGARERCLRDDFRPLQLQNPWRKGRLYVRQKHDVLAALEHSTKHHHGHSALI